jgi:signal transduction histidine kinase
MGERARIARDLHDVVAHHVSAIAVQAETARLTTEGLPEEGRAQFETIGQTARDALAEMRRLLGVLREDVDGDAARDPQPGLARLNELSTPRVPPGLRFG